MAYRDILGSCHKFHFRRLRYIHVEYSFSTKTTTFCYHNLVLLCMEKVNLCGDDDASKSHIFDVTLI